MAEEKKCACGHCCEQCVENGQKESEHGIPLADLPVGTECQIVKILPGVRGRKKLADIGIVPGMDLVMEAHAPFGGLLRVKVMETSMSIHKDDVSGVVVEPKENNEDK